MADLKVVALELRQILGGHELNNCDCLVPELHNYLSHLPPAQHFIFPPQSLLLALLLDRARQEPSGPQID